MPSARLDVLLDGVFEFLTPWLGDPRVNIQNAKGMAKPYQVRCPQALQSLVLGGQVAKYLGAQRLARW